jgi:methionyl aminopeptidase
VICHGIPDDRPLQCGDIVNLDITVHLNGYHGDCSEMFVVTPYSHARGSKYENDMARHGREFLDDAGKALLQTTYDCWILACQFVSPGRDYKDIGAIIEDHVVPRGFSTVRNFCGHGIGQVCVYISIRCTGLEMEKVDVWI